MNEPIEESYFNWLCAKVIEPTSPNHRDLMKLLHGTEFFWKVSGDKNREADGIELRYYFSNETGLVEGSGWSEYGCSVLEMLIAFSNRASFQTDIPAKEWFWEFLINLGIDEFRYLDLDQAKYVQDVVHIFIWRMYEENGDGGILPLRNPSQDQREVEIWYQFCEYLEDQGRL